MAFETELAAALGAARAAGEFLVAEYRRFQAIPDAPASISTEADRQSQEIILKRLLQDFPADGYCAEEATPTMGSVCRTGPRVWVIDPIDGTRGFARKNGEFSVMIAFVQDGVVRVGVVLEPARARLTYAKRGEGCWRQDGEATAPEQCRVNSERELAACTLTQTHSRQPGVPNAVVKVVAPREVVESYSAGIKLALVARGEADLYVNTYARFHDWDIAAGNILVEEAGGKVTGLHGEELSFGNDEAKQAAGLLATNGLVHEAALVQLRDIHTDQ
jgi:3'(2'), 5'-bisphosphate nucleotidase